MEIQFRKYKNGDAERLTSFSYYLCTTTPCMANSKFVLLNSWEHALKYSDCSHHLILLAEIRGEIIGWSRLFPENCDRGLTNYELGIGLLGQFRSQGIGSNLIQMSLNWAQELEIPEITLLVHKENTHAVRLFQHYGFQSLSIVGSLISMSKHLPFFSVPQKQEKKM